MLSGIRNLARKEAAERARLLRVASYDVALDLTDGAGGPGDRTFRSRSEITFACTEPGAATFVELAAERVHAATLNGVPVDTGGWAPERGLTLTGLAADNVLVVEADFGYSRAGQGLHRTVDPADGAVYLYSQFETTDAQRVFCCFDQPDLKAEFTWRVTAPAGWRVVSNMPAERTEAAGGATTVHFARSPRMSTYVAAVCAGPYHEVRTEHDGIDLGVLCRRSLAEHLDADDVFTITRQGFDFFHREFGVRYPLPKYDQLFAPDYNQGAMENFGCVTIAEEHYLFRSAVTDWEYEQRANTVLHELAHMWFGDLVTMRWWDDLWLNESFAEWASHWANAEASRFTDAWTTFLAYRKAWGYKQDQLSSTHPVYTEIPDVAAVEVNFDGITYAKGASIIKQLVAYVGRDAFVAGLRDHLGRHAWGNATFDDLLGALERASGRPLATFAAQWLRTAGVNTLRPEVTVDGAGRYTSVAIRQEAPAEHPTLRTHRLAVGLYDRTPSGILVRRRRLELDVSGDRTEVPELAGEAQPDVLLLNDDDLTYTKIRFDERSLAAVVTDLAGLESSLARGLCWAAAWDMVRDGELAARDYLRLVLANLPAEQDINLVTITLRQAAAAVGLYADQRWAADDGWRALAAGAREVLAAAAPGSDAQLAWARAFVSAARDSADLAALTGWLAGSGVPDGLPVDVDLRWHMLQCLVAVGAADPAEIEAELARDRTTSGERQAAQARALVPTAEAKAVVWEALTEDPALANWRQRALLYGFQHPSQVDLLVPYRERYLATVGEVWASMPSEMASDFAELGYPVYLVSEETVAATNAWLAQDGHPDPLRRLVAEGRDAVERALRARATDTARS